MAEDICITPRTNVTVWEYEELRIQQLENAPSSYAHRGCLGKLATATPFVVITSETLMCLPLFLSSAYVTTT